MKKDLNLDFNINEKFSFYNNNSIYIRYFDTYSVLISIFNIGSNLDSVISILLLFSRVANFADFENV